MLKKLWLIGMKDVTLAFRDRAALVLMLLAPFLLTVGMGFVTGRFSGNSGGLSEISLLVVNQDEGELGQSLVEVFESEELADLLVPTSVASPAEARRMIDDDQAAAAVIIPAGYTASSIPDQGQSPAEEVIQIELYANPARPTGAGVVQTIVEEFIGRVELGRIGGEVALIQMVKSGRIPFEQVAMEAAGRQMSEDLAVQDENEPLITVEQKTRDGEAVEFDILAYMAPGMALMFLMFTVTNGGRSLLVERAQGTLPRLLVSPTSSAAVLGGKVLGIYLTGVAQVAILIGGCSLLFGIQWGDPLGLVVLVLAAVFGATGWGVLLTALARTSGQVSNVGSALMLTFGILGGSFVNLGSLPVWIQWLSKITPNAWGLDGFTTLALGGSLINLAAPLTGLAVMGLILFSLAVLLFNRQSLVQR